VPAVDGDVVVIVCEAGADFVDAFFGAAGYEWIRNITHKTDVHT
jgi:hypothetical protein